MRRSQLITLPLQLVAVSALPLLAAAAPIYQCIDQQTGTRTFTHHGSPDPASGRSQYTPGNAVNFAIEPW